MKVYAANNPKLIIQWESKDKMKQYEPGMWIKICKF